MDTKENSENQVNPAKRKLTFRVLANEVQQGAPVVNDQFTLLNNGMLSFNKETQKKFNIHSFYVEFLAANEEGEEKNVYLRFRKDRANANCVKIGKVADSYFRISVPKQAASQCGMVVPKRVIRVGGVKKRNTVRYKVENYKEGDARLLKLSPIADRVEEVEPA